MKWLLLLSLPFLMTDPEPLVEWMQPMTYDFGDLQGTDEVKTEFDFRNISGAPLIVDAVRPGCGCTVPDWPEEAVAPDSTSKLTVWYKPKKAGYFKEMIKVYFHGQRKADRIYIEGYVVE